MPRNTRVGSSKHTIKKESDFWTVGETWLAIVRNIIKKYGGEDWFNPSAYYFDMNAGTGKAFGGATGADGSACIMPRLAEELGVPLQSYLCELSPTSLEMLRANTEEFGDRVHILAGDHRSTLPAVARTLSYLHGRANALVYWDGNGETLLPVETIRGLVDLPTLQVDILLHVSTGAIKRVRGTGYDRPRLSDLLAAMGKRRIHIQRPDTSWQWTFLFFTDTDILDNKFARIGFVDLESETGREWFERMEYTRPELQARRQPALDFDLDDEETS